VYCLGLAKGLIESGQARTVLVLTADTYSKIINPLDKSVRTLFSDAAAATVVTGDAEQSAIAPCRMGTDGRGADRLIVSTGGFREPRTPGSAAVEADRSGNSRSRDDLYMDGADVLSFSLREVPRLASQLFEACAASIASIDHFVFHQGSRFMLEALRRKMAIPDAKFVIDLEDTGNTVSSTLPIACARLLGRRADGDNAPRKFMLIGFGVGYSWAGTIAVL
jgi:3-oxoacyl-[acyl-carrier-protein] synthase-3